MSKFSGGRGGSSGTEKLLDPTLPRVCWWASTLCHLHLSSSLGAFCLIRPVYHCSRARQGALNHWNPKCEAFWIFANILVSLYCLRALIKSPRAKALCKWTQRCWPTTSNIVGCYMLHPSCCMLLGVVAQSLKPVKLWANNSQHFFCSVVAEA